MRKLSIAAALLFLAACSREPKIQRLMRTGNWYHDAGKYKEATIVYRQALQHDRRLGEAWYRLGLSYLKLAQVREAVGALRRTMELQPDNEDAAAMLGDLFLAAYLANPKENRLQLEEVDDIAGKMLLRNLKSFDGLRLQGHFLLAKGKIKEAIQSFREADRLKPHQVNLVVVLAQVLAAEGQFEEGENMTLALLEKDQTYVAAYDMLYIQYMRRMRVEDAGRMLQSKISSHPRSAHFVLDLAEHYRRQTRPDQMTEALARLTAKPGEFPGAHMLAGDYLYELREFSWACQHYEKGIQAEPERELEYRKKLVECLFSTGKRNQAVELADELAVRHPGDPEVRGLRAVLRMQSGNVKELRAAVNELNEISRDAPRNPMIRLRLAEALIATGDPAGARTHLEEAVRLRPEFVPARFKLADFHLSQKEYGKALQLSAGILESVPGNIPARLVRAAALLGIDDRERAREELSSLLATNRDLPQAIHMMATLDQRENRYADAEAGFRRLYFELKPPDMRGLQGLVDVFTARKRLDLAWEIVQSEVNRQPGSTALRMGLAAVAVRSGKFDKAIEEYNYLLQYLPLSAILHFRVGDTYRRAGKLEQAAVAFEQARKLAPEDAAACIELGMVYEALGQRQKARPAYEQALRSAPDHAVGLNNLANLLADMGQDLDVALTYVQRALQRDPHNPRIADTLGWIYVKKGMPNQALPILHALVEKHPREAAYRFHLGAALLLKGDKEKARREFEAALRSNPAKQERDKIRELLANTS